MRMVVTAPSARIYGRVMSAGEEFDCTDKEARVWCALARAKPAATGGVISSRGEQLPLVGEKANDQGEIRQQRQGRYGRRDMRAEG